MRLYCNLLFVILDAEYFQQLLVGDAVIFHGLASEASRGVPNSLAGIAEIVSFCL